MTKHEKVTNELLHLIAQHPDRRVVVQLPTFGIIASDEYAWWCAQFRNARLDELYDPKDGDRIYMRSDSDDRRDLEDDIDDLFLAMYSGSDYDEGFRESFLKEHMAEIPWKKVIAIELEAWEG